jgi:ABC-type glycerol-3-phosphate transport system permease component
MKDNRLQAWLWGMVGWLIAVILFFPIFWITITAFKTEQGAYSPDLIFRPTLESFRDVFARSNYLGFALNSIYISLGSTLLCFLVAIPAAYRMSFFPGPKTQSTLISAHAAPLTVFIASYSSPEGLFWAKLSAASVLAIAPILVMGWLTQKQLVRGLTFGAVK